MTRKVTKENIIAQLHIGIPGQWARLGRARFMYPGYSSACVPFFPLHLSAPAFPFLAWQDKFSVSLRLFTTAHATAPSFPIPPILHWNICPTTFLSSSWATNVIPLWESDYILTQMNVSLSTEFQAMEIFLICGPLKSYHKTFTYYA